MAPDPPRNRSHLRRSLGQIDSNTASVEILSWLRAWYQNTSRKIMRKTLKSWARVPRAVNQGDFFPAPKAREG